MTGPRRLAVRVYYEDTDSGGVVYYANYLRFLERARTELLRALGFEQALLARDAGIAFAVRSLQVEYLKPARLDDLVEVVTTLGKHVGNGCELLLRPTVFFTIAMNRMQARSNSGEGGEDPALYLRPASERADSRVKQVASARFGVTSNYLVNARELQIELGDADMIVLSHGHFDHWGGLREFLRRYGSLIPQGTPLYVGGEAFARRFSIRSPDSEPQDIGALDRDEIEKLNVVEIIEVKEPREINSPDSGVLLTWDGRAL